MRASLSALCARITAYGSRHLRRSEVGPRPPVQSFFEELELSDEDDVLDAEDESVFDSPPFESPAVESPLEDDSFPDPLLVDAGVAASPPLRA